MSAAVPTLQQAPAIARPAHRSVSDAARWGFLEWFVILQVLAPAMLYVPGTQALRVPIRILPFALSLAGLYFLFAERRRLRPHPSWWLLAMAVGFLTISILNPGTNNWMTGVAQVGLYAAVMAPVFWVPCLVRDQRQVFRVLAIILVCNGINATVGVMQVIDPDRFLPREYSTIVEAQGGPLGYVADDGRQIVRPPGLSDSPGAVCGPATSAAILGLVALTLRIGWWWKAAALGFAGMGVAAIFLSHVRTNILILGGMVVVYIVMLLVQRESRRAWVVAGLGGAVAVVGFVGAVSLGGTAVIERFASLVQEDPATVYYSSARGYMLQYDTSRYLQQHTLGAGLGRWGMMRHYFGDEGNPRSPSLWAELQWPAWALDGGIVLLVLYQLAVVVAVWREWRLLRQRRDLILARVASIIFVLNLGTVALIFGYTPFTNQVGLMYWFQAGLLHGLLLSRTPGAR